MDPNANQTGQSPLIPSEECNYGSNGGNSVPVSASFANVENNGITTQTKDVTSSALVSQPSPHESSPRVASSATTPGNGATTTPSRRSRRQRTPSAKKKAYIETERIFSHKRKSPTQTAAKTPESTSNSTQTKTAGVEIPTAWANKNSPPNARKSTDTATKNEFVTACKEAFTSPYVSTVAQTAVTTKCGVSPPLHPSKTATDATKLSQDPVISALSPTSPDLMNTDVLNTPSPASDVEDNLGLTLSETPEGFFADTDRSPRGTPPPKRTRVRTPFAKRPMDWSPLENEHTNQTVARASATQLKNSSTADTDKRFSPVTNSNCSDSEKENLKQQSHVSNDGAPNLSQEQKPILDHNKADNPACNKSIPEEMLQVQEMEHTKLPTSTMPSAPIARTTPSCTSLLLLRKQSTAAKTTNLQPTSLATSSSPSVALSQGKLPSVHEEIIPLAQSSTTSTSREVKNVHQPTEPSAKQHTEQTSLLPEESPNQYPDMAAIVKSILPATASSSDQSNNSTVMSATKAVALSTASATASVLPKLRQSSNVPALPALSEKKRMPPGNAQSHSQRQTKQSFNAVALPYSHVTQGSQSGAAPKKSSSFVLPPLPTTKRLSVIKPKAKPMPEDTAKPASTPQTSPATNNMNTTAPTCEPFRNAGIMSTPVQQRTSPFSESTRASRSATPLRRSTRKASLLSASKIKKQLSATKSASIASMALEDPLKAMSSNGKTVKDSSGKCENSLSAVIPKDALEEAKTSLEDELNNNMERAKTTPSRRSSRRRSMSSLVSDSPTSTESSSVQTSKKRCSNRRASISLLDTQLQTIVSQTQEGAPGSIVFDDSQESRPKKRRTSRRASTSVLVAVNCGQTSENSKAHAPGGNHAPRLPPRQPRRARVSTASKLVGFQPDQDMHSFSKRVVQSSSTRHTTRRASLSSTRHLPSLQDVRSEETNKASPVPLSSGESRTLLTEQKHEESKVMAKPSGLEIQIPKPTTANLCVAGKTKTNFPFGASKNQMIVDARHAQYSEEKQGTPLSGTKNEADKSESEFTPRRSARRKSMSSITSSASSTKQSVNGTFRVLSSHVQNSSIKKQRLLSSTGKTTIKPFDLHTLSQEEPESTAVKLQHWMITKRAQELFANNAITRHPCVSARIFACYTLIYALQHSKLKAEIFSSQVDRSVRVPIVIQPLMPLLTALVRVEMVSLEDQDGSPTNSTSRNRRVHFSGFDCSSTKPPVDARVGSHRHQQDCISALIFATQHINALTHSERSNLENEHSAFLNIRRALTAMASFLKNLSCNSYILQECAKSISDSYSPRRLGKAIDMYIHDFETVLARLSNSSSQEGHVATYLEWRLAEFVGQSIRFHLRRLFNPPPLPYTTPDEEALAASRPPTPEQVALRQSRVYELIDLELPTTSRDSAVADGSVSSLFSIALSRIYDFFGMEAFVSALTTEGPISIPDSFCTSPSSMRGLGTKQHPVAPMTQDELEELLSEIDEVFSFLSAYKACKFLLELISVPGVRAEVDKVGGWSKVEHYAKIIRQHNLGSICLEDAHFSVLGYAGSMERFFSKIEDWLSHMEPKIPLAEISIQQLAKRYKTTTTSPKQLRALRRKFPHVKAIAVAIEEGRTRATSFPKVVMVDNCSESDGA